MRVLDLFSGIGGFSLGLDRAGFETIAFCEIDPYCQRVLEKRWPGTPIFTDVRKLYRFADEYAECDCCGEPYCEICEAHFADCDCYGCSQWDDELGEVDVITAGFPCQDISLMNVIHGDNDGTEGERSGLWREATRLICSLRPRYAILENVTAMLIRGFGDIGGELAEIGYDCEWHCISAASVGLKHVRDRSFIIAYHKSLGVEGFWPKGVEIPPGAYGQTLPIRNRDGEWQAEPDVRRIADGVPNRVERLRALGNAVCPPVVTLIGKRIMEVENELRANR